MDQISRLESAQHISKENIHNKDEDLALSHQRRLEDEEITAATLRLDVVRANDSAEASLKKNSPNSKVDATDDLKSSDEDLSLLNQRRLEDEDISAATLRLDIERANDSAETSPKKNPPNSKDDETCDLKSSDEDLSLLNQRRLENEDNSAATLRLDAERDNDSAETGLKKNPPNSKEGETGDLKSSDEDLSLLNQRRLENEDNSAATLRLDVERDSDSAETGLKKNPPNSKEGESETDDLKSSAQDRQASNEDVFSPGRG